MAWTSPRTWLAGETVTAALLNAQLRDNLKAIGDSWTAYTPTWTASSTNPTIGNGTLTGQYVAAGKLTYYRIRVTFGSTTNVGAGNYTWTLPVSAIATHMALGTCLIRNSAGTTRAFRFARNPTASTVVLEDTAGAAVSATAPLAWAAGDTIDISGMYEAA